MNRDGTKFLRPEDHFEHLRPLGREDFASVREWERYCKIREMNGLGLPVKQAGESISSTRFPAHHLRELERTLPRSVFSTQYLQEPSRGMGFNCDGFTHYSPQELAEARRLAASRVVHSWDPAGPNGYTGFTAICYQPNGYTYLMESFRRQLGPQELLRLYFQLLKRDQPEEVLVEANSCGMMILQAAQSQREDEAAAAAARAAAEAERAREAAVQRWQREHDERMRALKEAGGGVAL
jgi:hypothetical protein